MKMVWAVLTDGNNLWPTCGLLLSEWFAAVVVLFCLVTVSHDLTLPISCPQPPSAGVTGMHPHTHPLFQLCGLRSMEKLKGSSQGGEQTNPKDSTWNQNLR